MKVGSLMVDIASVVAVLGTFGIGSAVGGYLSSGKARREVRSKVLEALSAVESSRWCDSDSPESWQTLTDALHKLEVAALVARVPYRAVDRYRDVVRASLRHLHEFADDDEGTRFGLDSSLADQVAAAAADVARLAWSPVLGRVDPRLQKRIRDRTKPLQKVQ